MAVGMPAMERFGCSGEHKLVGNLPVSGVRQLLSWALMKREEMGCMLGMKSLLALDGVVD